jgi:hypothetical protein
MSNRRLIARAALAAALALAAAPFASAQQGQAAAAGGTGTGGDVAPRRPLMQLLDKTPLGKTLDDYGLEIHGHVEAGYTWNFQNPPTDQNAFRVFDFEHDELVLNQIDLTLERRVNRRANKWDVGGVMEWIYGGDAGFIHANGIFDWYDGPRNPENQFDPTQFYVDVAMPFLGGSRLRLGKFVNLVGYESINPTTDFIGFYSRSFVFGSGYPFTHFGALYTFDLNKNVTITAGVTRGDEQGFKDNNDAVSFLGSVNWQINKDMALYVANSTGPEQPDDNGNYRTTWDATFYWQPTHRCRYLPNGYFLGEGAGAADGDSGYLYSVAALASYEMCREATFKLRGEYFRDEDGLRIPAGTNLYELTVGLDVVPFASDTWGRNLMIRPEFRFDFSDDDVFNGDDKQYTAGIDVIVKL